MSQKGVIAALVVLGKRLPKKSLTEAEIGNYMALLEHLPDEALVAAVDICLVKKPFLPDPGELHAAALEALRMADGRPDAAQAWALLERYLVIGAAGHEWLIDHTDPAQIHPSVVAAVQTFGVRRFITREADSVGTDFAQFRVIYNALTAREEAQLYLPLTVQTAVASLAETLSADRLRLADERRAADQAALPSPAGGAGIPVAMPGRGAAEFVKRMEARLATMPEGHPARAAIERELAKAKQHGQGK